MSCSQWGMFFGFWTLGPAGATIWQACEPDEIDWLWC